MIRPGTVAEINSESGAWVYLDMGFSKSAASCGILVNDEKLAAEVTFNQLCVRLLDLIRAGHTPLNLVIEAPLSVAFNANGNPTGRSVERRESSTRNWYLGAGSSVLVAATYLMRAVFDAKPSREIRLFEGLASFKPKGTKSSHSRDVLTLREIVRNPNGMYGRIVKPEELVEAASADTLISAFAVAGMDFGVPPVVEVQTFLTDKELEMLK